MKTPIMMMLSVFAIVLNSSSHAISNCNSDVWMWDLFKKSFISLDGRVIDNANRRISHSEGQGYGMLMAEYYSDSRTFQRLWRWTRLNLQRDEDPLFSWKWQPKRPHIPDHNNASDGDLLIAWALHRASEKWPSKGYDKAARSIVFALQASHVKLLNGETVLLPGTVGFSFNNRTILNPSYWVYPAMDVFSSYSNQWALLSKSGLSILNHNLYGRDGLTPDWIEYANRHWRPASDFPPHFSYSSYRIPLYVVWGKKSHQINDNYVKWLKTKNVAWTNVTSGEQAFYPPPEGARAVAQLVSLAKGDRIKGEGISFVPKGKDYYSDSLVLLSHMAFNEGICE
ncbi:glycosyl hydrolase family 8 [Candidatus Enterovibrio escicola]|uniref:cellulase n=3 Tax=Candidatus Enterovibrio escicola TaxID=1927127 RepID=A0A2A5SZL2_9GAMM|nr:glycosyl hydrolase family 8 [Candidatus Enterovibrio escacola]PCS21298.1 Endoglucanase precursor [Candidatus Enterovibrio escacola]